MSDPNTLNTSIPPPASDGGTTIGTTLMFIFQTVAWIGALFLAFRCRGMDPIHLLVACCCPYCYIPYGLFCLMKGGRGASPAY